MDKKAAKVHKRQQKALNQSYWGGAFSRLRQNKLAMVGLVVLIAIVLACVLVPVFSPYEMYSTNTSAVQQAPSWEHPLGTDDIGRDILTRLFYGGRYSLGIALAVAAMECVIGIILGALAGFYRGIVDSIIMRVCDVILSFPMLVIGIAVMGLFGNSIRNLIILLAVLGWPAIARIVRGQILTLREQEYMEACEALGISDFSRIFRHLLPNVMAYVIVYATLGMASVILTETSLSFIGLGVSEPDPTWGNMINTASNMLVIRDRPWYWIPSGLAIFLSVMCFNLVGDGLRDAIDPKLRR